MHFWQVQTRFLGGVTSPVKYFFMGAIPEFIKRSDLSLLGTSEKLGSRKCPLLSKKERYFSRKSLREVHFIIISPENVIVLGYTKLNKAFVPRVGAIRHYIELLYTTRAKKSIYRA